jgi:hypothetical protein
MAGILAAISQAYSVLDAPFIHASAVEYRTRVNSMKMSRGIEISGIRVINDATLEDFRLAYKGSKLLY